MSPSDKKGRVSLRPVAFEEAVADLLKVKPPPGKKRRRGKQHRRVKK